MVEKLEAEKIIVDYVTHIDWTKVKEHTGLTAMIDVKVTPKHGVGSMRLLSKFIVIQK